MKKIFVSTFVSILLLLSRSINTLSQGFNWQYSPRLPISAPHIYIGIFSNYAINYTTGSISFLENKLQCPNFNDANGSAVNAGLSAEYWLHHSRYAIRTSLCYSSNKLIASTIDRVPLSPILTAEYETQLNLNYSQLTLSIGGKYRIPNTHLAIGANLNIAYSTNSSFNVTEQVLGPAEVPPYSTNPPSYKRNVLAGELNQFTTINLTPDITLCYDIPLGLGTYIEPIIGLNLPLTTLLSEDNLTKYGIFLGISVYRGIK